MGPFFKMQYERLFHVYHRLRNVWLFWFYVSNAEPRRLWKKIGARPDAVQEHVAHMLIRGGIAIIPMGDLMGDESLYIRVSFRSPLYI